MVPKSSAIPDTLHLPEAFGKSPWGLVFPQPLKVPTASLEVDAVLASGHEGSDLSGGK